jgi:hypothetical protein
MVLWPVVLWPVVLGAMVLGAVVLWPVVLGAMVLGAMIWGRWWMLRRSRMAQGGGPSRSLLLNHRRSWAEPLLRCQPCWTGGGAQGCRRNPMEMVGDPAWDKGEM